MGHTRLGPLPTTRKWRQIVAAFSDDSTFDDAVESFDVRVLAAETLLAAEAGLERAKDDPGLRYTFFLLSQLALASREENWRRRLEGVGIALSEVDSLSELTAEIQYAVDDYLSRHSRPTDISEIAQKAAGEAVSELSWFKVQTLFGSGEEELKNALRPISTKKGFGVLGQKFFGRFVSYFLNFYLSRATAASVGRGPLQNVADVSTFNEELRLHCEQSARIVRDFCSEWYSKTEFLTGITIDSASMFVPIAIKKLQTELQKQREDS